MGTRRDHRKRKEEEEHDEEEPALPSLGANVGNAHKRQSLF
ncbi:hypothetical protein KIPB_006940, partial [Kipferlia bialata]|eukprot:g6940.t1